MPAPMSPRPRAFGWFSLCLLLACSKRPVERVSAAISLKSWLDPQLELFRSTTQGHRVEASFGASGILERQIEAGAPVAIFLSASPLEVDRLAAHGLVAARRDLAQNELVLGLSSEAVGRLRDARELMDPWVHRIALGRPSSVPAGRYAEETLERLGLWQRLGPKFVYAEHVAEVRAWLSRGEVEAGFIYRTEARGLAGSVPLLGAPAVRLVAALLPNQPAARELYGFLTSPDRLPSLTAAGFTPP